MTTPAASSEAMDTQFAPLRATGAAWRWGALAVGILALSTGSILVRLAQAPPLAVGAWRMFLATAVLTPWALPALRREARRLERRDRVRLGLAGMALALHFATWITSLSYTTVASSVILVSTNPLFVGLASHYLLQERVNRLQTLGILLSLVGAVLIGYGDLGLSGQALLGDGLALLGAVAASVYLLLGRSLRRKLSTLSYIWPCYGLAALWLLVLCLLLGQPLFGYGPQTYLVFALLALVPQIIGHSSFNWALAHFSVVLVTVAILGEPLGASLLAWLILGEVPPATALVGGLLLLAGIYLASRGEGS